MRAAGTPPWVLWLGPLATEVDAAEKERLESEEAAQSLRELMVRWDAEHLGRPTYGHPFGTPALQARRERAKRAYATRLEAIRELKESNLCDDAAAAATELYGIPEQITKGVASFAKAVAARFRSGI